MSQDALRTVLNSVDEASNVLFGYEDIAGWPMEEFDCFIKCGLLRETAPARSVVCDGCEEACLEDVEFLEGDDSRPARAYVVCQQRDDIGRVEVPTERLRQWAVNLNSFAKVLGELLETDGKLEEIVQSRLWWLGSWHIGKRRVDFFLAVGTGRRDGSTVFGDVRRIRECFTPVILIPTHTTHDRPFGVRAKTLLLTRLLAAEGSTLHIDRDEISRTIGGSRAERTQDVAPFPTPPGITWNQVVIEFCGDEAVKITVGSVVEHKSFGDMGFVDRRKTGEHPDQLWGILRMLAQEEGSIAWTDETKLAPAERPKLKKWISEIRARLSAYFPTIAGDPFEQYRKANAYKTKFVLTCSEAYRRSLR